MKPTAMKISPIGANSNIENSSRPASRAMEAISMLVEVPISVHAPPKMDMKERGMSSREGLMSIVRDRPKKTGMNMATAAVLLMKADMPPTSSRMRKNPCLDPRRLSGQRSCQGP